MAHKEVTFNRDRLIKLLHNDLERWDMIVIGGGATGLGIAMDAASRGFRTLLLEKYDFAKGTSSRSTKLVHGGVRYLAQGNIGLVFEALHERGLLIRNAPHIVKAQSFIIPVYSEWDKIQYTIGLKAYDLSAGKYSLGKSTLLNRGDVLRLLPNVKSIGLKGGVLYFDGQFDDSRLAINMAQTAVGEGAVVLNYIEVKSLLKDENGKLKFVVAEDLETKKIYHLQAKTVINATGVFVDSILEMDTDQHETLVRPSQGIHLVLDKSFLPGNEALMIPKTADGRVLFAIPWHGQLVVGTTDTPLNQNSFEPVALEHEIQFILTTLESYLIRKPSRHDVLSVFAGLRPLAAPSKRTNNTKEISRSHKLIVSESGLITITGGKWTTFRKMADDTVSKAIKVGLLPPRPCKTEALKIHGYKLPDPSDEFLKIYGSDKEALMEIVLKEPATGERLHPDLPYIKAQVIWAVRAEMARTVEDVLARRLRALFPNAKAAIEMAPKVAEIIANELSYNEDWKAKQINEFVTLANKYLLEPYFPVANPLPR